MINCEECGVETEANDYNLCEDCTPVCEECGEFKSELELWHDGRCKDCLGF